ncbi:polyisoprenoid-binding protein [Actinobacteria bacterium YIM 96077]|uniref:Polyisoprenoid-binding protein n=1 Tax=Phytoactinopolyspora halophila TaxID=1981511 RepID=A0A329Q9Y9_9ACTN|nr:YceI family protein [Phytoactinopolyspora halophila]AYY12247.1 polyisoprenoid-binding protein [Actinobacteria bacterium YIM 96077]RAW09164.1 polyisoprenoid-binding protein [Phytoactinopolyspora halophila]
MSQFSELTGKYTIDPEHSRLGFVARHAMVTKVRGSFNDFSGSLTIDGDNPEQSSAQVTIKAVSIDTRNEQRDGHLRTNDFLDVEKYPEITFVTTGIRQTGDETFEVTGDLTIKDVTRSVTIPFEYGGSAIDPFGNFRLGFDGSVTVNRHDFNVTWNAPLETGGVLLSDKVTLEFEVSAIKQ